MPDNNIPSQKNHRNKNNRRSRRNNHFKQRQQPEVRENEELVGTAPVNEENRRNRRHSNRGRRHLQDRLQEQPEKSSALGEVLDAPAHEPANPEPDDSAPLQDKEFGYVRDESQFEPQVQYESEGVPAPVDFDYFPGQKPQEEPSEEEKKEMTLVVGVKFRSSAHSYFFAAGNLTIGVGTAVIVETARGLEYGTVSFGKRYIKNSEIPQPLRSIVRIATDSDSAQHHANLELEEQAFTTCKAEILKHGLSMKLIDAQYTFDNAKLLFYFSSEGRVDFRELVKDLASIFHTRIELRQIGIRDEARLLGGLGACGRQLCCSGFLTDFAQVSIKMAKEQNLSLNSGKISGCCGRLLCCLHYEHETYEQEIAKTPPVDSVVQTADGIGVISATYPLAGTVRVTIKNEKGETVQKMFSRNDVTVLAKDALPKGTPAEEAQNETSGKDGEQTGKNGSSGEKQTGSTATNSDADPASRHSSERRPERTGSQDDDPLSNVKVSFPPKSSRRQSRRRPDRPQRNGSVEIKNSPEDQASVPSNMPGDELDGVVRPAAFNRRRNRFGKKRK